MTGRTTTERTIRTTEMRQLNVQVPPELVEMVAAIGEVDEMSLAACVREALADWADARRRDRAWQARRRERLARLEAL